MSLQYRYSLLIIILYATQLLYCNGDCSFTPDGSNYTYDFGELQKMGKQSTGDKDNSDISYEFMICGNLSSECDVTPNSGKGSIQQFTDGSCTEWLGSWDTGDEVSPLNDTNPDAGIIISWGQESGEGQGNVCHDKGKKIYYQTQFMFQCDKTTKFKADYVTQSDYDTCIYEVHIRTGYACPGYTPAPGPSSSSSTSSFSMGYVAIICFFSAIILGLLIYYIVLGATSKNWGKESLAPPLNLCKYFWIYTCVGCKVTYEFAKNKMSKDGDSGGIDDDVLIDTDE